MNDVIVRRAELVDADVIAAVLRRAFAEFESCYTPGAFEATTPGPEEIARRLDEGPIWVALKRGAIVGTASAVPHEGALYLRSMAVLPEARRCGAGRGLLEQAEAYARCATRPHARIELRTTPFLTSAICLYQKAGFRFSDAPLEDLWGTPLLAMTKVISPEWHRGCYVITTDRNRLDRTLIHDFLVNSYWAKSIPLAIVARSIEDSLPFGLYDGVRQIGFARVISDYATFAYIADVFIIPEYRGQKLSEWLMEVIVTHPELQGLRRWVLATRDAHGLYEKVGFRPLENPSSFMERFDPHIYLDRCPS